MAWRSPAGRTAAWMYRCRRRSGGLPLASSTPVSIKSGGKAGKRPLSMFLVAPPSKGRKVPSADLSTLRPRPAPRGDSGLGKRGLASRELSGDKGPGSLHPGEGCRGGASRHIGNFYLAVSPDLMGHSIEDTDGAEEYNRRISRGTVA